MLILLTVVGAIVGFFTAKLMNKGKSLQADLLLSSYLIILLSWILYNMFKIWNS